jgi:lipopolysaccharide transport system permease protein
MIVARILDMRAHVEALRELATLMHDRWSLLVTMTWRDLSDRYAGQVLGAAWAVISPLMAMATYLIAFGVIFRGRLGPTDDGTRFVAFMLAGLVPWMAMQECLGRATGAITNHANLVKQIVFPSEILPLRVALSTLPLLLIGLLVTIPISIVGGAWHPLGLLVLLPAATACLMLLLAGLSFWLAAIGVFARDVKDLVTFLLGIGLFLHPVLYPPDNVPAWLSTFFVASPFSHMIWCYRDALTLIDSSHAWSWVIFPLVSILAFTTGWRGYRMLKPSFGNVL